MKRKIFSLLLTLVLAMVMALPVFAAEVKSAYASLPPDLNVTEMTEKSIAFVNTYKDDFPRELSANDIDFSKAYRFYIDTDIFKLEIERFDELAEILNNGATYIFEVPIFFENGDVYIVNIQRNVTLRESARDVMTEKEIAEYQQGVGKWTVSAVYQYLAKETPFVEYYEIVKDSIEATGAAPLLVGSLPYFRQAVAIFPDENGNLGRLIPLNPDAVSWDELGALEKTFAKNGWLDYSEVKAYIKAHPFIPNPELAGGGGGSANEPSNS